MSPERFQQPKIPPSNDGGCSGARRSRRKTYLLQNCNGGYCGNSPMFWKEGGCGYTPWIDEAKRWTFKEARAQIRATRGSHSWQMWPLDQIEKAAKRTVDIQDLRKAS